MRARLVLCAALLGACAHGPLPPRPAPLPPPDGPAKPRAAAVDESFRANPPEPGPEPIYRPPSIEEARLDNGVRVLLVRQPTLPIVAVHIGIDRGADQARPGLGAFMGAMLMSGTRTRSALALSDALRDLGASYAVHPEYDGMHVEAEVLLPMLPETLDLLADVLKNPAFESKELERERKKRLTSLGQEKDSPETILRKAIDEALYPALHPYAHSLLGDERDIASVSRGDLVALHARTCAPDSTTVAFAGDLTMEDAKAQVSRVLGAWKGKAAAAKTPGAPPARPAGLILIDRPGAAQSHVGVALAGVPRKSPDFDALLVMNTILGGQFSSRLNLNLREKHAYTYGASSFFDMRHGPGPFVASSAVVRESTAASVREVLAEMDRLRSELVSPEELADAVTSLTRQLPARFETAEVTAATEAALAIQGLALDEFATRPARLSRVTREDVQRVAAKYLPQRAATVVVVGDASVVQAELEALVLGKERLMPLEVRRDRTKKVNKP
jgi:zinc protease